MIQVKYSALLGRNLIRWLCLAACVLIFAQSLKAHSPRVEEALATELSSVLSTSAVVGAAIVLVDTKGVTGTYWWGMADAEKGKPMTAQTCLRAGPVSETLTSILAMRLVNQGWLTLDEPLPPEYQPAQPESGYCDRTVTVGHLLEHTAGLTDQSVLTTTDSGNQLSLSEQAEAISSLRRIDCPGQVYKPSENGLVLAAATLEQAGGDDYNSLIRREVLRPLQMDAAAFDNEPARQCLARGYDRNGLPLQKARTTEAPDAAQGLIASPLELAKLTQLLVSYGSAPVEDYMQACTIAGMTVGATNLASDAGINQFAFGKGLSRRTVAGQIMIGHSGSTNGFQSAIAYSPENGKGMVIMLNTETDPQVMTQLREVISTYQSQLASN